MKNFDNWSIIGLVFQNEFPGLIPHHEGVVDPIAAAMATDGGNAWASHESRMTLSRAKCRTAVTWVLQLSCS